MTDIKNALNKKVKKCKLINLNNGASVVFLMNPNTMSIDIGAEYSRLKPIGFFGDRLQYAGNQNAKISFTAVHDDMIGAERIAASANKRFDNADDVPLIPLGGQTTTDFWIAQLQEFVYPEQGNSILGNAPAPTMFIWPNVVSMRVVIKRIRFSYRMFYGDSSGTRIATAQISMEEVPVGKINSSTVFPSGFVRPSASNKDRRRG